jgi:hypothetical protein
MLRPDPAIFAEVIKREYELHPPGEAWTFILMYRLIRGLTGFSRAACLEMARTVFKDEAEEYAVALAEKRILPPLDREEFLQRRMAIRFSAEMN